MISTKNGRQYDSDDYSSIGLFHAFIEGYDITISGTVQQVIKLKGGNRKILLKEVVVSFTTDWGDVFEYSEDYIWVDKVKLKNKVASRGTKLELRASLKSYTSEDGLKDIRTDEIYEVKPIGNHNKKKKGKYLPCEACPYYEQCYLKGLPYCLMNR